MPVMGVSSHQVHCTPGWVVPGEGGGGGGGGGGEEQMSREGRKL